MLDASGVKKKRISQTIQYGERMDDISHFIFMFIGTLIIIGIVALERVECNQLVGTL